MEGRDGVISLFYIKSASLIKDFQAFNLKFIKNDNFSYYLQKFMILQADPRINYFSKFKLKCLKPLMNYSTLRD